MNTIDWMICLCTVKICYCYGKYVTFFLKNKVEKMLLSKCMNLNKTCKEQLTTTHSLNVKLFLFVSKNPNSNCLSYLV